MDPRFGGELAGAYGRQVYGSLGSMLRQAQAASSELAQRVQVWLLAPRFFDVLCTTRRRSYRSRLLLKWWWSRLVHARRLHTAASLVSKPKGSCLPVAFRPRPECRLEIYT